MKKGDKGKKVLGVIVILAIIVSVFGGVVSAEDVSRGLKQSVDDAETAVGDLSSEELTEAVEEDPLHQLPSTSGKAHYAVADGYAWSGGTENPSGGSSTSDKLRVGFKTASGNYRTLIKFDLSSIPAGATITSADLKLYYYGYVGTVGDPLDLSVYRTTVDWNEGYLSWSKAENYHSFSYDTVTIIVGSGAGYKTWDITALVQNWVDGTYSNYGVLLRAPTQSGSSIYRTFRSKEYGSNVPKLEVTYTEISTPVITGINPPEPVASPTRQWISILGTGFVSDSTVTLRIGSSEYPIPSDRTDFRSSTEIRVYVGLTDPGTWSAQVTNPVNCLSNIFSFTVVPEIPTPVITGINPPEPVASPTRQWISILGTGFVSDSTVTLRIGSETYPIPSDRTDFRSSTEIRVYVGLTDPGTWSAQVTNPVNCLSNIFSFTVIPPNQVTAAIDQQILDLIDQYAGSYYNSGWNLNINQYKAWVATIAWAEGGRGGYVAHSQYGGGTMGDRFDHRAVGSDFRFSTGIGPFQLDRGSTENWEFWPTIDKLDPEKTVKSVLRLHYNTFGAGADLEYLAENSRWCAVNPNYGGDPAGHWNAVTGTNWNYHKNGKTELDWSNIKNQLAQNADNPDFLYENNVRSSGTVKWNIKESEGIQTDTEKKVIFDGYYLTWLITARGWGGTELFEYYYTYRSDENIEIWVWDNSDDPINKFRYIFVREYSTGPFPERRDGNIAGETLTSSAILEAQPPTASASDISNQPDVMHPDTLYEVTAKYYDPDGRANLGLCTLGLTHHPSDNLVMGWSENLKLPIEDSEYITYLDVDYTPITDSYEGYQLTWKFKLSDTWPEAENCIDFCVHASDDDDLVSGWDYDNTDASFVVVQPPEVTTNSATSIATSSATLNGNLDSTGGETCQVWFQYGKTTSYSDFLPSKSKSSTGPFSDVLSGLDDDTIYHFRAVASNSEGTVFGSDMTFKTDKEIDPPLVSTNAATNVEETTATLNGVINMDGGEACQYRFEYDTNPGEPYAHNTGWTGSKTTGQSFNAAIPSLVKGTKYYFRAQAKNSAGTASGSELTFLTKPDAPTSFSATTAGTTQIDLSWTKGAGAQKTRIQRKQGSYPANRNDGTQVYFGTGSSTPDTGLTPGTTYYYRAWSYVQGSEQWSDNHAQDWATTTSIGAPTVTTNAATNVEETTATLNGMISSDGGEACQYRFEYDTNSGEPYAYNTGWTGSKTTGQSFNQALPSLNKGTKYYFRAQAKNSAGTASGSELTFLTKPDAPTSFSATTAGTTQIDLSWTKGAGAQKTKIQRKQGSYPANRNDGTQVYFGTGSSTPDTGLTPGTTYYYRAWSYVQGSEQWSDNYAQASATTTSIGAPTVTTNAATNEGTDSAQLNGHLDDRGGANSCDAWFVWDTSYHSDYNDYGYSTSPQTKSSTGSFDDSISGLEPDTTYHFRAVASNSKGTNCGSDMTFTTSEEADTTPPTWGTMIGIQSATDTGNGGEVTVTYGTATDADSPPVKYNAYYSTSSPATGGTKVSNVGSSPYTVTGLTNGQLYYFSVRAEDSATPPNEDTNTFELTATPTAPDSTPPSAVTDLSTINPTSNSIKLTGTAPGDDGNTGTATTYDIRYLEGTPITESDWASAIQCTDEPSPNPAGSAEAFVVTGLSPDTTYYFALKTADEVPNWSPISNSPSGTTEPGEVSIISIDPSSSKISAGSTTKINLTLDKAPNGLSGYNLTVSLSTVTVAEIVSVSFPSWATLNDISSLPADSVWMKATDLSDQVKSGATDIKLGTLTLRGDNQGTSDIVITVTKMDDNNGYPINPNTISGQIEVTSVIPIPGHTNPPTDPDSDGLYEDLNGNGMKDFDDVVQFFKYMEWIEDNEPIACFDFNGNGLIDFADIVALFKEV